jgi:hypothetical protein
MTTNVSRYVAILRGSKIKSQNLFKYFAASSYSREDRPKNMIDATMIDAIMIDAIIYHLGGLI